MLAVRDDGFTSLPGAAGLSVLERYFVAAEGATQVVDEQAVGDLEEPRGERATRVVAVPGPVNPQE